MSRSIPDITEPFTSVPIGPLTPWRVGIIVDGDVQDAWIAQAIRQIKESSVAEVALAVIASPKAQDADGRRDAGDALTRWFVLIDRRVFRRQPDPLAPASIRPLIDDIGVVRLVDPDIVDGVAHAQLLRAELDVIICFGDLPVARQMISAARRGVWYYPDLASDSGIVRPIGWNATVTGTPVVETSLCELRSDGQPGRVQYRAVAAVNRYSPHVTEGRLLWKMATYPVYALTRPHGDAANVQHRHAAPSAQVGMALLGSVARLGVRLVAQAIRSAFFRTEWTVAYGQIGTPNTLQAVSGKDLGSFTLIDNPRDRFWADPFPISDGDKHWLFVEEFLHNADRAHLAVMELLEDGSVGPSTPILTCPYHLSYPFVFRWQGQWYMVPETLENEAIDLYRCTRFPFDWIHERRLLGGVRAVDATLAEIDGRWWMFTAVAPLGASENTDLHLYHATTPMGPWLPHQGNPQISDVRRARPAGRVFEVDGTWYRPAQDCSRRYGYAMTINRITTLSETEYGEELVARIEPTWAPGLLGTHTINHDGCFTLIDGERRRARFSFWRGC